MKILTAVQGVGVCLAVMLFAAPVSAGNAQQGKSLSAQCSSCHGPEGQGMGSNPALAGMDADAFVQSLKAYQAGERKHMMMEMMAKKLSEQEMADLAAYYASL
ncbi:hypothetical protein Tel_06705 [Candidatus Tenderia electrophaga]|uniref:Cytochrome c domain-containing protein n=1 Tax=Candidatus Tenderia electrophaga TaxID=1748243 RepID=A0A0S2TCH6_9GAMM|nr:hypothetical protein Tel_06705 [Candidatus Tenderia electrophaga]